MNERGKLWLLICKLVKLALNQEPVLLVANNNGGKGVAHCKKAPQGLLKKRLIARKAEKLLGKARARQRPKPSARTTAENDRAEALNRGEF